MSMDSLVGKTITITPFSQIPHAQERCVVQLTDMDRNMYYIPAEHCQTFYVRIVVCTCVGPRLTGSKEYLRYVLDQCFRQHDRRYKIESDRLIFYDVCGTLVEEQSWNPLLEQNKDRPLLRLKCLVIPNKGDRTDVHRDSSSDSSEESRGTSPPGSSFTSRSKRDVDGIAGLKIIEDELQEAYQMLHRAEYNQDHETIYTLGFRQIPEMEAHLLSTLNQVYVDAAEPTKGRDLGGDGRAGFENEASTDGDGGKMGYERTSRRQRRELARENDFNDMSPVRGLSDIASFPGVDINVGNRVSSETDSMVDHVDHSGYEERIWYDKGRRSRMPKPPSAQYVPARYLLSSSLKRYGHLPSPDGRSTLKHNSRSKKRRGNRQAVAFEESYKLPSSIPRIIPVRTDFRLVLKTASRVLCGGKCHLPFFLWPLGFELHLNTEEQQADTLQSGENADTQEDSPFTQDRTPSIRSDDIPKMETIFMNMILEDVDHRCRPSRPDWQSNMGSKVLYKRAESRTLSNIEALFDATDNITPNNVTSDAVPQQHREDSKDEVSLNNLSDCKRTLYTLAKQQLGFFAPLETDTDITTKYWGAIYRLIVDSSVGQRSSISNMSLTSSRMLVDF